MQRMVCRFFAILCLITIGFSLAACEPPPRPAPPPLPPPPVFVPMTAMTAPSPPPPRPAPMDQPNFYRLRNTPVGPIPARVALLLPFSSPSADNRSVAQALEHAAELAIFDAKNPAILLMPRDDGGTPEKAIAAATKAINDGAEIIVGPLFATSVTAIAPVARAHQ